MSRHRLHVEATAESINKAAIAKLDQTLAAEMCHRKIQEVAVDLLANNIVGVSDFRPAKDLRRIIANAGIADLEQAELLITMHAGQREAACVIAGEGVHRRRMTQVHVRARTRIKTRWLHIWRDADKDIEWPTGSL